MGEIFDHTYNKTNRSNPYGFNSNKIFTVVNTVVIATCW